jgi:flagellar biosynthesis regulator FlaF
MRKLFCFLLSLCFISTGIAQPSNAQVKGDAIGNGSGVIGFAFTKTTGTRQWNSSAGNWEYVRGVEVKRKSEYPGINLIVKGDVVYQYTGAGKYSYWKFRILSNEYEGIPNPTAKEINDFISKDWEKFYGYYYNVITKLWFQPTLADKPEWIWHSPNSVEFRMKMKFDYIIRAKGIETLECVWKVRLYRDDPKASWKDMFALRSEEAADLKVIGMKDYTVAQMEDFEKQTLEYTMAEQTAKQQAADLSKIITVPAFTSAEDMIRFLHDVLRNGNPEKLRAVILQIFAPGFFVAGSKVQLLPAEEQNFANVISAVYNNKVKYKQLYCQSPNYAVERWGNSDTKKDIKIKSVVENCNTQFTVDRVNMGYVEGVPVTRLAIVSYGIYVRQDQDVINYINSFSDPKKMCPND